MSPIIYYKDNSPFHIEDNEHPIYEEAVELCGERYSRRVVSQEEAEKTRNDMLWREFKKNNPWTDYI